MQHIKQIDPASQPYKFKATNVRIAYPDLAQPRHLKGDASTKPRYSVTLLLPKSDKESYDLLSAQIRRLAKENLKMERIPASEVPLVDGDERDNPAFHGCWMVRCYKYPDDAKPNGNHPQVVDTARNPIQPTDSNYPYSGCTANVIFDIYTTPKYKRVNAGFGAVQFVGHGDVIGGGNDASHFDVIDEDLD